MVDTSIIKASNLSLLSSNITYLTVYYLGHAMRFKDSSEQELYLKEATNAGTVELVYAGLDVLGSTPWKINRAIFDVVVTVWNSGERMGKMPPAVYDQPEPEAPENIDYDLEARSHHLIRHRAWAQAKANTHSERCNVNYKVEIARAVSDVFSFLFCPSLSLCFFKLELTFLFPVPCRHFLFPPQLGLPRTRISHSTTSEPHWR